MAVDQKATSASWGGGMAPMAPPWIRPWWKGRRTMNEKICAWLPLLNF